MQNQIQNTANNQTPKNTLQLESKQVQEKQNLMPSDMNLCPVCGYSNISKMCHNCGACVSCQL